MWVPTPLALPQTTEADEVFLIEYRAMQLLDLDVAWAISWFEVEDSPRPLAKIEPRFVSVLPLAEGAAGEAFWPPKRLQRRTVAARQERQAPGRQADFRPTPEQHNADEPEAGEEDPEADEGVEDEQADEGPEHEDLLWQLALAPQLWSESSQGPPPRPAEQPPPPASSDAPAPPTPPAEAVRSPPPASEPAAEDQAQPPPAQLRRRGSAVGPRGPTGIADSTIMVLGGKISYYANKNTFEAVCDNPLHGRCVMSRTSRGRSSKAGKAAGRPLGFLLCWLEQNGCQTKAQHWDRGLWQYDLTARQAARRKLMDTPGGPELAAWERPPARGEGLEPDTLDGLM